MDRFISQQHKHAQSSSILSISAPPCLPCKLQFLLNATPNCRHMLERSQHPSETNSDYSGVSSSYARLPLIKPPEPELSPAHLSGISTRWQLRLQDCWKKGREKNVARMNKELREEMGGEKKSEIEKKQTRVWKALLLNLIIRFLNSDGCGWICIALGWQWPTFLSQSFCTAASAFHYVCQGEFCDEENNSAGF